MICTLTPGAQSYELIREGQTLTMERVLIVASLASSLVRFRGDLIRSMRTVGCDVIACAPDPDAASVKALDELGVTCHPVSLARAGLNPFADLGYMRGLRRII